jgi:transcriptional regulator
MTKPGEKVELLQGTLEMMLLRAIAGTPMHGFGIARWIESVTHDRLTIEEGALYPALHRMEKRGWLRSEWRVTENGRRARLYSLTPEGRGHLTGEVHRWEGAAWAIERVLRSSDG